MDGESSVLTTTPSSKTRRRPLSSKGDKACQFPPISADRHLYEFKYFAKLPAEIRNEIWNLAFSPRSPRIYILHARRIEGSGRQYPHYQYDVPGLMSVCKEVREITTRNRKLSLISGRHKFGTSEYVDRIYGWVDPKRDSLYIDLQWNIQDDFHDIENIFETLILCPKRVGNALHLEELSYWSRSLSRFCISGPHQSHSSRIKKLQLVCRSYSLPLSRFSFGTQNDLLILDLDKENDINWLLSLRSRLPNRERNLDWQFGILNDRRTGIKRFEGRYYIRLSRAGSGAMQHLPLPTDVQVDVLNIVNDAWADPDGIPDDFHGFFWFMLPWTDYATLVGQVWASSIGIEISPDVRRVVQFHLKG
ncbi:uncharacterized protein B0J16DRAFT_365605 [Fusarium flagelliforme]|uniref:uncharacterized protein n=1 Tax=Fusarium flagelliforme TaxID=2675880 RepID=UPI001E8CFF48|nr:uncharacterized protein B0J16DRAFT_365605 [Fusarium flagelliforme]KAH7169777.1 hypothetical protein B0J16DRAFT_365605 [Fusarium flagelliforme]